MLSGRWMGWLEGPLGNNRHVGRCLYPTCVVFIYSSSEATVETVFRAGLPCQLILNAVIILHLFSPLHFKL